MPNIRSSLTPILRDPTTTAQQQINALGLNDATLIQAFRTQYGRAETVRNTYWSGITQSIRHHNDAYTPNYAQWRADTQLADADLDQLINWYRYQLAPAGPDRNRYRALIGLQQICNGNSCREPNGMTDEETLNAFQTKVIMADPRVRQTLMGVLFDPARFEMLSDYVIWREITRLPNEFPGLDERQLAASFAYYHNGGETFTGSIDTVCGGLSPILGSPVHDNKRCEPPPARSG